MDCPLCARDSARYTMTQDCCQLRYIAKAPDHIVKAFTRPMMRDEKDAFRLRFVAERKRLFLLK